MNKKLLDALVEELPDKLGAIFGLKAGGRACSTFSRLLTEVLSEFGIASEVRSVHVETANQAGMDYLQGKISFEEAMKIGGKIQVLGDIRMGQSYQHAVCYIPGWNVIVDLTSEPRLSKLVPMHPYWAEWGQLPWWIRGFEFRDYPLEYRVYETRPAEVKRAKEVIRDIVRRYPGNPLYPHVPKKKELYPHRPRESSSKPELLIPREPPVKLTLEERKWWNWALEGLEGALEDEWFVRDNPDINILKGQLDDLHYRLTEQAYDVAETDTTSAELAGRVRALNSLNKKLNSVRFFNEAGY